MPLDLVCWRLTFDLWSPVWPPGFQVNLLFYFCNFFLAWDPWQNKWLLPPFSLKRDFGKQNTRGNVSKISVSLKCYQHIGSKSTNHSPLAWRREGQKVTLKAVIGEFRSDLSITRKTDGNFGNISAGVFFSKVAYQRKRWWLQTVKNAQTIYFLSTFYCKISYLHVWL